MAVEGSRQGGQEQSWEFWCNTPHRSERDSQNTHAWCCLGTHGNLATATHLPLPLPLQVHHTKVDNGPQVGLAVQNLHKAVGLGGVGRRAVQPAAHWWSAGGADRWKAHPAVGLGRVERHAEQSVHRVAVGTDHRVRHSGRSPGKYLGAAQAALHSELLTLIFLSLWAFSKAVRGAAQPTKVTCKPTGRCHSLPNAEPTDTDPLSMHSYNIRPCRAATEPTG